VIDFGKEKQYVWSLKFGPYKLR